MLRATERQNWIFSGTDLMPTANGQAKVESKKGYIEIGAEFGNLQKPTTFGNEYLTNILWAISPEGCAINLGEILVGDNHRFHRLNLHSE